MFIQKFKQDQQVFILNCNGDRGNCNGIPAKVNVIFPGRPLGKDFVFPNEKQEELVAALVKFGLPEKCKECLQKTK
jgi:hypothetical protein